MTIPTHLIENALALTGKKYENMFPWMTDAYESEF